jgi:small multidrug resistance pump
VVGDRHHRHRAVGVAFLGEPISAAKVAGIALVVTGVMTLNLAGNH